MLAVCAALVLLTVGCAPSFAEPDRATSQVGGVAALAGLPTTGPAPLTGYDRAAFGDGWADFDGDSCDTRDEVLARDAAGAVFGPDGCVAELTIRDPYTGRSVDGRGNIDVDHVVALSWAWRHGAAGWPPMQRERFANDLDNLQATADEVNAGKGDSPPSQWLPPDPAAWCGYGWRWVSVVDEYELWVPMVERDALAALLETCPG